MNEEESREIERKRGYLVVKGNDLVRNTRYELSLMEQKTVSYICSMIKPMNVLDTGKEIPFQLNYKFNIREYAKICGIDYDSGKNYELIKSTLKKLADRSMWLTTGDKEVLCRWLSKVRISKKSGVVEVILDEDLAPYLFNLGQKFTEYSLYNILPMKSAYSIKVYELMKSYAYQKTKTYSVDEFKRILNVHEIKSYENFKDFRKYVLEKAINEINEITDINLSYDTIKRGRKVVKIRFDISRKCSVELYSTHIRTLQKLNFIKEKKMVAVTNGQLSLNLEKENQIIDWSPNEIFEEME